MRNFVFLLFLGFACSSSPQKPAPTEVQQAKKGFLTPEQNYGELFEAVQLKAVFSDSKTFADCTPKQKPDSIMRAYQNAKTDANFDLKAFVTTYFALPEQFSTDFVSDQTKTAAQHISSLWSVLRRQPEPALEGSSLITLPKPYIVPGGRFGEIYYWDSYFTMQGLVKDKKMGLVTDMIDNFAYLIDTIGHIPNGNRTYYLSRSQPPFFAAMVQLLAKNTSDTALLHYLPQLEKEYLFWCEGSQNLTETAPTHRRVVRMPDGSVLNRYCDDNATPRPEAYKEDVAVAKKSNRPASEMYKNLRSGAESGWDFSSRWFADEKTIETIETIDLIPVDLNCLLYNLENAIAKAYEQNSDGTNQAIYNEKAQKRAAAIQKYCWNETKDYFGDYNFVRNQPTNRPTMAMVAPLYFGLATPEQAKRTAQLLEKYFLKDGGFTTTLVQSGQQWDAPNAWSPLQFMAIKGLENYAQTALASKAKARWVALNTNVYKRTGKMLEKYNVYDTKLEAGGGEYPLQDGFGWTNGVLLNFLKTK